MDQLIGLVEKVAASPIVKAAVIGYGVYTLVVIVLVVVVFAYVLKEMHEFDKRFKKR